MSKRLTVVISTIFGLALLGLGVAAAIQFKSHRAEPELATSFIFPTAKKLAPFSLKDQHGNLFSNSQLADKWSLFFIGYTSCPDVCPTTMGKLSAAYPELLKDIDLQIIFLSVDPQRDTQEKLLAYMDFFNPEFTAITGEHAQLFPLTRDLGFVYAMVGEGENYQVDHSASMALISPEGRKVAIIKPKSSTPGTLPQILTKNLISDIGKIVSTQQ
ncbi:SCO family protein [Shewanella woodyi]|uniref:Electron transport protein SCO1/SenC n=1 Tax=Shewanella woodyi (strain ATCC 51908 / MS32) TaxID=392500 RepID=B1KM57_SHEWM|nr:SCO family protein [Shewanella woodyi]ACA84470.1 electron transport protein SCO1/SenC [Shewanella woodyi ATCC 51908]